MDNYCQDRLYMPRRTKRYIRVLTWFMVLGFAGGLVLLAQDGTLQQGLQDWQKASATIISGPHKAGE